MMDTAIIQCIHHIKYNVSIIYYDGYIIYGMKPLYDGYISLNQNASLPLVT